MLTIGKNDGSFGAGFHALGFSSAEIAHIHDFIENFDRADRTGLFTNPAKVAYSGRNDNLAQRSRR